MLNIRKFLNGLRIYPKVTSAVDTQGELDVTSGDGKLHYHDGTTASPVVTETQASQGTHRLKNKDLEAGSTAVVDGTDTTKQVLVDVSGATTGTSTTLIAAQTANRQLTLPDVTDTLATLGGTGTLTNKNLDDASVNFVNSGDATKKLGFSLGGATTGTKTSIVSSQTANRAITLPDATDTLVGKATTDTLTNKTLAVGSNHITSTADRAAQFNSGTGDLEASAVTTAELALLSGVTGSLTTSTNTQNLSNKSLIDNSTLIVDNSDNTKAIAFDAGGTTGTKTTIAAAQTANRVITLPDITDTVVTRTSADQGANRLKNKDLNDGDVVFVDSADTTKKLLFDVGGSTGTITNVVTQSTVTRTINLPDADTNLVGDNFAQTITNKDLNGGTASSTNKWAIPKATKTTLDALARRQANIFYATDQNKAYIDNGTQLIPVGSGSGTGGVNFIGLDTNFQFLNSDDVDAENTTGNWATYKSGTSVPTTMTGGSATHLTLSRTTTVGEVLDGQASFKIVKTANNAQGEGVSVIGNVPLGYRGNSIAITLPFKIISGSLVSGDLKIFVEDVTNSTIITPFNNDVVFGQGLVQAIFPISATTAQIRVGFHFASTSTTAVTFTWDDVFVGLQTILSAPVMTGWQPFSMVITGGTSDPTRGTVTTETAYWRRVGDSIEINYLYVATTGGSAGSGYYFFGLPFGLVADPTKVSYTTGGFNSTNSIVGMAQLTSDNASSLGTGPVFVNLAGNALMISSFNSTQVLEGFGSGDGQGDFSTAHMRLGFFAKVPIVGWQTNLNSANSSVFNISQVLLNGTRVTAAPAKLGEYRTLIRDGVNSNTTTDTNGSSKISVANGIQIYSVPFNTAGTSTQPNKWEIFVGKNKTVNPIFYGTSGRTGNIDVDYFSGNGSTLEYGIVNAYDPTTGIYILDASVSINSTTNRPIGWVTNEGTSAPSQPTNCYFDLVVSENVLPVQVDPRQTLVSPEATVSAGGSGTISNFDLTIYNVKPNSLIEVSVQPTVNSVGTTRPFGSGGGGTTDHQTTITLYRDVGAGAVAMADFQVHRLDNTAGEYSLIPSSVIRYLDINPPSGTIRYYMTIASGNGVTLNWLEASIMIVREV